jgi:RNA polymerase sigma-70 factor (ECF subfamily)
MMPSRRFDTLITRSSLLLRLRPGGADVEVAWSDFYDRYAPVIGGFARRLGARTQDVEDVVQDVLAGFFSASPTFVYDPTRGRFRGYLKTCTVRAIRKRFAADARASAAGLAPGGGGVPIAEVDVADPRVERAWNDCWESDKLRRALDTVRERYASNPERAKTFQAFEMYALLDRPSEEVARELGMSVDSVHAAKSRITRALREAADAIEQQLG